MNEQYTVMIVNDNSEDRYMLKRYLSKTKLSLVTMEVSGGPEGIELLTTPLHELESRYPGINAPVTLFLDINMPLMNGWEFVEELEIRRHQIALNPMVVLMYSSSESAYDINKSKEYKAVANYIVKGKTSPESLKQAILSNHQ